MMMLPDTRPIQPLEFESFVRCHSNRSDMQCVWIAMAAIAVIYVMNQQNTQYNRRLAYGTHALSGMISRINPFTAVSARIQRALPGPKLIDASRVWPELPRGLVSLIDNSAVSSDTANEPTSDAEKQTNYKRLHDFVNSGKHTKACIVIFAHWCPHCKTLIRDLVDSANEISKDDISYLLVNGESVASEAFMGETSIVNLKHYPTILCKMGDAGSEVASLEEARQTLAAGVNASPDSDTLDPPTEENDAIESSAPLDELFF